MSRVRVLLPGLIVTTLGQVHCLNAGPKWAFDRFRNHETIIQCYYDMFTCYVCCCECIFYIIYLVEISICLI